MFPVRESVSLCGNLPPNFYGSCTSKCGHPTSEIPKEGSKPATKAELKILGKAEDKTIRILLHDTGSPQIANFGLIGWMFETSLSPLPRLQQACDTQFTTGASLLEFS